MIITIVLDNFMMARARMKIFPQQNILHLELESILLDDNAFVQHQEWHMCNSNIEKYFLEDGTCYGL